MHAEIQHHQFGVLSGKITCLHLFFLHQNLITKPFLNFRLLRHLFGGFLLDTIFLLRRLLLILAYLLWWGHSKYLNFLLDSLAFTLNITWDVSEILALILPICVLFLDKLVVVSIKPQKIIVPLVVASVVAVAI